MIIKILNGTSWTYYDNVSTIEEATITYSEDLRKETSTDFLLDSTKLESSKKCKRVSFKRIDGTTGSVVFNSYCYILNDMGRTIDKI